jgi:hypothetical protein
LTAATTTTTSTALVPLFSSIPLISAFFSSLPPSQVNFVACVALARCLSFFLSFLFYCLSSFLSMGDLIKALLTSSIFFSKEKPDDFASLGLKFLFFRQKRFSSSQWPFAIMFQVTESFGKA